MKNFENSRRYEHLIILIILIGFIITTTIVIVNNMDILFNFILFYAIMSFGYLFYRYFFGVINYPLHYFRHKDIVYEPFVSIVIPCYNEEKEYLVKCITSVCNTDYPNKEVIVVDDGSTDKDTCNVIKELNNIYIFKAFRFADNRGKRHAMALGFREAKGDVIITIDSDSVITSGDSIRELVKPLINKRVGTVSGCILVNNTEKSFMTRLQDARYWIAFFIEKSSQNPYNSVTCASGPFSAYRREYLMEYLDKWENQIFLDTECTYGDDRGLTTFMLKNGYDVKFSRDAILYTNVPETLGKFIKQQIRWKKSFIRENWYLSKFIYKRNILMNIEFIFFWVVFISGYITKAIIISLFIFSSIELSRYIMMLLFVTFLHYTYAFIKSPGKRGYFGVLYGILNEFIFVWLFIYALATMRDGKWGTR